MRPPRHPPLPAILLAAALLSALHSSCLYTPSINPRPTTWAQPQSADGLPNLHQVSKDLYRSAQPKPSSELDAARLLGVKTVINLRPSSRAANAAGGSNPEVINIPVHTGSPSYQQVQRFFDLIDDPTKTPILLHCYHGADRTGAFTALYRINRQGWTQEQAIAEMTGGGYHFHTMWNSLIPWVQNAPPF